MYKIIAIIILSIVVFSCNSTKNKSTASIEKVKAEQQFENTAERDTKLIKSGIDFYASGSEPHWTLVIDFDRSLALLSILGDNNLSFKIIDNKDNHIKNLTFELEDNNLRMEAKEMGCNNSMSGEGFPYSISFDLNGKIYTGCGKYLGESVGINSLDLRIFNKWKLDDLKGVDFDTTNTPYFSINKKTKRIGGFSSCNNFGGIATLVGNTLNFGPFMMTKKYCGHDSVEQKFMSAMAKTQSYYISDNKLVFLDGGGNELMSFLEDSK